MAGDRRSSLESVIRTAIDNAFKDIHIMLPAVVTKVNMEEQLIDAQIVIKRKMAGSLILLPPLVNVPIRYQKSSTFSITFPIEIGDHVKIYFCERSIDNWLINGGLVDPFDVRKFSLSDAFAEPCMYPQTDVIPDFDDTNLEIKTNSGNTKIVIRASEGIDITTVGNVNVVCDQINQDFDYADIDATTAVNLTSPLTTINGDVTVNGTINGTTINASNSLTVNSKEMSGHTHPQGVDSNGDTQQNTGAPI